MHAATDPPRASPVAALLAGLHSGILGVFWMLAWLGVTASWQQRSFWTAENLMASAVYGARAIHSGFAIQTLSGLAVYFTLYGLLGAALALVLRDRLPRTRTLLVAMVVALAWYYLTFRVLWRSILPLVALLHVARTTAFGHVIYGFVLGLYPRYLRQGSGQVEDLPAGETTPVPTQSSSEPDPTSRSENS